MFLKHVAGDERKIFQHKLQNVSCNMKLCNDEKMLWLRHAQE